MPVFDFLHRRGYGHDRRNLTREYRARAASPLRPPADDGAPRIQPGQLIRIAHRVGEDVLKRPVSVGPEHRRRPAGLRRPDPQPPQAPGSPPQRSPSALDPVGQAGADQDREDASKSNRSASSAMHLYDTDNAFRDAFDEAADRIRAMEVRYITVPEDEDAGALQALVQLHAVGRTEHAGVRRRRVQQRQERLAGSGGRGVGRTFLGARGCASSSWATTGAQSAWTPFRSKPPQKGKQSRWSMYPRRRSRRRARLRCASPVNHATVAPAA